MELIEKMEIVFLIIIFSIATLFILQSQENGNYNHYQKFTYKISGCIKEYASKRLNINNFYVGKNKTHILINGKISTNCCSDELKINYTTNNTKFSVYFYEIDEDGLLCRCLCPRVVSLVIKDFNYSKIEFYQITFYNNKTTERKIWEYPSKNNGCYCILIYDPVCGEDGKTYSNECFAKCAGVKVKHKGEC